MWHLCIKYMLNSLLGGHCQIDTRLHPLHHHTDLDTTYYWKIIYFRMKNIAWCQQIMRCKNSKLIDAFLTIIVYCHEIKSKNQSFLSMHPCRTRTTKSILCFFLRVWLNSLPTSNWYQLPPDIGDCEVGLNQWFPDMASGVYRSRTSGLCWATALRRQMLLDKSGHVKSAPVLWPYSTVYGWDNCWWRWFSPSWLCQEVVSVC